MSDRFVLSLRRAVEVHRDQLRKRTATDPKIPYVAHLLSVCGLVLQDGGTENEAIAALLHDAPEDRGGQAQLARIKDEFGSEVAGIVAECSDTFETPKPPWRERKETYLAHLPAASTSALRVSIADKLDNARSILLDYERLGEDLWLRFDPDADQIWYYRELVAVYRRIDRFDSPLIDQLDRVVSQLKELMSRNASGAPQSLRPEVPTSTD